ncbi:hypothetical protein SROCM77S_02675 [Streptomyces rochei]
MDVLRAHRVAGDGRDEGGVDTAGQTDQHRAEPVLRHVGAQSDDEGRVDLLVVVQPLREPARQPRLTGGGSGHRLLGQHDPVDAQPVVHHAGRGVRVGGGQVEVEHHAPLGELRRPRQHLPVPVDHDRVAVEDQLVLTAGHGEVGGRAAGLLGALADQLQPGVVLVPLVRRGVDRQQQPGPRRACRRHPAAVLPQVLADGQRHVHPAHPHHRHGVAGHEVAELVEDAVVRQVVLGEAQGHLAAVQHGHRVLRGAGGLAVPRPGGRRAVQMSDDHRQPAEALVGEARGEGAQGGAGRLDEGRPQRQVLDGITGQDHLGERHQVRSLSGRVPGPAEDRLGVAVDVADGGVDLVQGES